MKKKYKNKNIRQNVLKTNTQKTRSKRDLRENYRARACDERHKNGDVP